MRGPFPDGVKSWFSGDAETAGGAGEHGFAWRLINTWNWPAWATLLVLIAAAALIYFAYRSDIGVARRRLRWCMAGLRFTVFALVLAMIARWVLVIEQTDLPTVAVLVDVSQSMRWADGIEKANEAQWRARLAKLELAEPTRLAISQALLLDDDDGLIAAIADRYRLAIYLTADAAQRTNDAQSIAEQLRAAEPSGGQTRLGDGLALALDDLQGRSVAAAIVLSDGVTTAGKTLAEVAPIARRRNVPIFAVAIGSRKPPLDVEVADLTAQDVAFVGDTVYFDATINTRSLAGQAVRVALRREGASDVLAETTVTSPRDEYQQTIHLAMRPSEPGQFRYTVEAAPLPGEHNTKNNAQQRTLVVVKQKVRVLFIEGQPRYEYRFLKHLLERDSGIELRTVLQDADRDFHRTDPTMLATLPVRREELQQFDVIFVGDVDPSFLGASVMESLRDFVQQRSGGIVFLGGPQFMPGAYAGTPLDSIIPFDLANVAAPGSVGRGSERPFTEPFVLAPTEVARGLPQMRLADTPEETARLWSTLPAMYWYLEASRLKGGAIPLAEHPTARTPQGQPLPLAALLQGAWPGKTIVHAIDATYLWRTREDEKYFARYWIQTIRFLAQSKLLGQDRRAELTADRRQYRQGMPVTLQLRFFAEQDAPLDATGVSATIEQTSDTSTQAKRTVAFRAAPGRRGWFLATLADLPAGTFTARLIAPKISPTAPMAEFTIAPPPGEMDQLQVDIGDLTAATQASGGKLYTVDTAGQLADDLPVGRQTPTTRLPDVPLWNSWPMPILFLLLIVTEWVLRKRSSML